jgi:concanavalin A-like lectin/glucanase superfamily protein
MRLISEFGIANGVLRAGMLALVASAAVFVSTMTAFAVPVTQSATYRFNNSLAADEIGAAPLVAINPLGLSRFEMATVYGLSRRVYHFDGSTAQNAGLQLDTRPILSSSAYTIEMVAQLLERDLSWRRLIDTQGRQLDDGFYVDPSNSLAIFPDSSGQANFITGQFHYIVLTYDDGIATGYFDGDVDFMSPSTVMDLFNPRNPFRVMSFFLDNNTGPATGEYSDGRVALLRMTDGVLDENEIALRAIDPFAIPEPSGVALCSVAALLLFVVARRKRLP